jgi:ankyrin repeat protein
LLHIACGFGYDNIIQLLISDSITKNIPLDLNVRDVNGNSPLELSKKMKHIEVTNILVNEIERQTNGFLFNGKKEET